MTLTNYPNGISSFGVPVLGPGGGLPVSGHYFFVDSNSGADGNAGTYDEPMASWDAAIGRCVASRGDVIVLMPGHTDDIDAASAVTLDVIGVTVVGLGTGRLRPTITWSAAAGSIVVSAAEVTIENVYFDVTGVDSVNTPLDVGAADFVFRGNEVLLADGTGQADKFIDLDENSHRAVIEGNIIRSPDAGAANAVDLNGTSDGVIVRNNLIYGDFSDACVHNPTGNVATNVLIQGNVLENTETGDHALELVSAVTGYVIGNSLVTDAIATAADLGSCKAIDNWYFDSSDTDKTGTRYPTTAGTGGTNLETVTGLIGTPVNTAGTATLGAVLGDVANVAVATRLTTIDANQDKGIADAVTNLLMRDVVGDKADAAVTEVGTTKSLAAYAKGLVGNMWALPQCVEKSDGAVLSGDDPLFTITGGPIKILSIVGIVTTEIGAGTTSVKLQLDTDAPAATVELNAGAVDIDADAVGTSYRSINTTGIFTPVTAGFVLEANSFATNDTTYLAPTGTIQFNSSAARDGVIKWYLSYVPLSPNSRVVAAA